MTVQLSFDTAGRTTRVVATRRPDGWTAEVELDTGDETLLFPVPGRYGSEQQAHQAAAGYIDAVAAAKAS